MAKRLSYRERGPKKTPNLRYRRGHVLDRHAINVNGEPLMCPVNTDPRRGRKVAYPSWEAAEAAAVELAGLRARPLKPYQCQRDHTHYHLTTDRDLRPEDQAS